MFNIEKAATDCNSICALNPAEFDAVSGGNAATTGEAVGSVLIGVGLAIAPETAGAGLVVAAVGGLILGYSAASDANN